MDWKTVQEMIRLPYEEQIKEVKKEMKTTGHGKAS